MLHYSPCWYGTCSHVQEENQQEEVLRPKLIAVDIDQTLTVEMCFTPEECLNATPNEKAVHYVNELYDQHFIVIYTGRRICLAEATLKWLTKHHVRYHAIRFEKMPYDLIIDNDSEVIQ